MFLHTFATNSCQFALPAQQSAVRGVAWLRQSEEAYLHINNGYLSIRLHLRSYAQQIWL